MFQRPGPLWKAIGKLDLIMPVLPRPWSTKSNRSPIFSRVSRPTLKGLLADSVGAPKCPLLGEKRTCRFALHMSAFDPKRTLAAEEVTLVFDLRSVRRQVLRYSPNRQSEHNFH